MPFYAFRLDTITVKRQRGKVPDDDIVTFSVFLNQVECGRGAGFFPAMATPSPGFTGSVPAQAVTPGTRSRMSKDWIIGPLDIAPGELIHVVYSGTNISDSQITGGDQDKIEIKILDSITTAAVGAIGGPIGAAIGTALGFIADPEGTILGFSPQGPCNGQVFSDTVEFSGGGLDGLAFQPPTGDHTLHTLSGASEFSFTQSYTDAATHNSATCGEVALYDVSFSVLHVPFISLRERTNQIGADVSQGLRQLMAPKGAVSLRSFLLRP